MVGPDCTQTEVRFSRLRQKLDEGGYLESFGIDSFRLVEHLFNDLLKTTKSLQKSLTEYGQYKKVADDLEDGVAPFKEENVRLYKENSQLRMGMARAIEDAEDKARDPCLRLRELEEENNDLKLLVSQFAERVRKVEIESLEKTKRIAQLQEKVIGANVNVSAERGKARIQQQSMEMDYFVSDACPQCIRLRNYAEYGKKSDRNSQAVDYMKLADSRIAALQLQVRTYKASEKDHISIIANLKNRVDTRDTEVERLRSLIKIRPGCDNLANAGQNDWSLKNGKMERNLAVELKTAELQLQIMQKRNLDLEEKLKTSILQEHDDYMLGKIPAYLGDKTVFGRFLGKELDKYPSHDKMTLLEKLYNLELQLSHCCKEKAILKKRLDDNLSKQNAYNAAQDGVIVKTHGADYYPSKSMFKSNRTLSEKKVTISGKLHQEKVPTGKRLSQNSRFSKSKISYVKPVKELLSVRRIKPTTVTGEDFLIENEYISSSEEEESQEFEHGQIIDYSSDEEDDSVKSEPAVKQIISKKPVNEAYSRLNKDGYPRAHFKKGVIKASAGKEENQFISNQKKTADVKSKESAKQNEVNCDILSDQEQEFYEEDSEVEEFSSVEYIDSDSDVDANENLHTMGDTLKVENKGNSSKKKQSNMPHIGLQGKKDELASTMKARNGTHIDENTHAKQINAKDFDRKMLGKSQIASKRTKHIHAGGDGLLKKSPTGSRTKKEISSHQGVDTNLRNSRGLMQSETSANTKTLKSKLPPKLKNKNTTSKVDASNITRTQSGAVGVTDPTMSTVINLKSSGISINPKGTAGKYDKPSNKIGDGFPTRLGTTPTYVADVESLNKGSRNVKSRGDSKRFPENIGHQIENFTGLGTSQTVTGRKLAATAFEHAEGRKFPEDNAELDEDETGYYDDTAISPGDYGSKSVDAASFMDNRSKAQKEHDEYKDMTRNNKHATQNQSGMINKPSASTSNFIKNTERKTDSNSRANMKKSPQHPEISSKPSSTTQPQQFKNSSNSKIGIRNVHSDRYIAAQPKDDGLMTSDQDKNLKTHADLGVKSTSNEGIALVEIPSLLSVSESETEFPGALNTVKLKPTDGPLKHSHSESLDLTCKQNKGNLSKDYDGAGSSRDARKQTFSQASKDRMHTNIEQQPSIEARTQQTANISNNQVATKDFVPPELQKKTKGFSSIADREISRADETDATTSYGETSGPLARKHDRDREIPSFKTGDGRGISLRHGRGAGGISRESDPLPGKDDEGSLFPRRDDKISTFSRPDPNISSGFLRNDATLDQMVYGGEMNLDADNAQNYFGTRQNPNAAGLINQNSRDRTDRISETGNAQNYFGTRQNPNATGLINQNSRDRTEMISETGNAQNYFGIRQNANATGLTNQNSRERTEMISETGNAQNYFGSRQNTNATGSINQNVRDRTGMIPETVNAQNYFGSRQNPTAIGSINQNVRDRTEMIPETGNAQNYFDSRQNTNAKGNFNPNSRERTMNERLCSVKSIGVNTEERISDSMWTEGRSEPLEKRALMDKVVMLQRKLDELHADSSSHQLKSFELQGELERTKHMLKVEKQELNLAMGELKRLREQNNENTARILLNSALGSDDTFRRGTTPMEMEREIVNLRAALDSLDRDKDEMRVELDRKDEKLARLGNETSKYMDEVSQLKLRLKNSELQISHTGESAKEHGREVEFLKKQLESNRRDLEKTIRERDDSIKDLHKISGAHAKGQVERRGVASELEMKSKEADDLRKQVQRYIDEVRRIEELLLDKEEEMEMLIQHYRAINAENSNLEAQRTSLEREASSIRESVRDAVDQSITSKTQLASQNALVQNLEEEIQNLTQQVTHLENQMSSKAEKENILEADVKASKDLLYRMEVHMDKMKLDVADCESKRKQLEAENTELNAHILSLETRVQEETERQHKLEALVANSREKDFQQERTTHGISRERDDLVEQLTNIQQRSETLNTEISRYRLKSIELQSELDRTRRQLDTEKRERETAMNELKRVRDQLNSSSANFLISTALSTTESSITQLGGVSQETSGRQPNTLSLYRSSALGIESQQRRSLSREQSPIPFTHSSDALLGTPNAASTSRNEEAQRTKESNPTGTEDEFEAWESPK